MELTNKSLSETFSINFAKWKRWNREFLTSSDTISQRGYLKIYGPDEAFTVFLGGYLVSILGYSIYESKIILGDLLPWLRQKGFLPLENWTNEKSVQIMAKTGVTSWIFDITKGSRGFSYQAKGIIFRQNPNEEKGIRCYTEKYVLEHFETHEVGDINTFDKKTLLVSSVLAFFRRKIGLSA